MENPYFSFKFSLPFSESRKAENGKKHLAHDQTLDSKIWIQQNFYSKFRNHKNQKKLFFEPSYSTIRTKL